MKTNIFNKVAAVTNSSPKVGEVPQAEGYAKTAATSALTYPLGASATPPNLGGELNTPNAAVTNCPPKLGGRAKRRGYVQWMALLTLLLAACTQDDSIAPVNTTGDALALLPADTPVGVFAELKAESGETVASRADDNTDYYATDEIHPGKEVTFRMDVPGGSGGYTQLLSTGYIPFNALATTEPFSTLRLKDFHLTEGDGRCVSRWTVLHASYGGFDDLYGWARLTADATTGRPVLNYTMQRASAKVTIVVQDKEGNAVDVSAGKVSATLSLPQTYSTVIYTPKSETEATEFGTYCSPITTLAADKAIDPDGIGIATVVDGSTSNGDFPLGGMVTADGTRYYGPDNNALTHIVRATATHTRTDNGTYAPIIEAKFNGSEKLTIEVLEDPDDKTADGGTNGPQTTGTYSLALSDVTLGDGTQLTALKPGEHYILTVTLQHNTLVSATATIAPWEQAGASATLGSDDAKLPSYTYDAATNTYTVIEEAGIAEALADRAANHPDAAIVSNAPTVAVVDGTVGGKTVGDDNDVAIMKEQIETLIAEGKTTLIVTGETLAAYDGGGSWAETVVGEAIRTGNAANGTITLVLPDATSIGNWAFYKCSSLTSVSLPKVTSIGHGAINWCTSLTSVSLPEATTIGNSAFLYCTSLTSVSLPAATSIGDNAFEICTSLTSVSLPLATTIGDYAFNSCTSLKSLTFGSVITSVGTNAFDDTQSYETIDWTPACDLTLAAGQTYGEPNTETKKWADYTWKSITIKNTNE